MLARSSATLARLENAFGARLEETPPKRLQTWFTHHPREFARIMEIITELGVSVLPALEALHKVASRPEPSPSHNADTPAASPPLGVRTRTAHTKKAAS